MNAKALYLSWLRQTAPELYTAALRKVAGKPRGLGGLGDDLVSRMCRPCTGFGFLGDDTSDLPTITVTAPDFYNTAPDLTGVDSFLTEPGGLTVDPSSFSAADLTSLTAQDVSSLPTITEAPDTSAGSGGLFSNVATAVASIVTAGMTANNQSNLLKVNTQRASQGLPPVDSNGVPIRTSLLTPSSNPTIARIESTIAGAASSPLLWVAGLGLLGFLLLRKRA
jgi:hypothetical protein